MNDTIYWDKLEAKHAPLVCSPNGGDPDYAFVCWYTLDFVAYFGLLNSALYYLVAFRKFRLARKLIRPVVRGNASSMSTPSATRQTAMDVAAAKQDQMTKRQNKSYMVQFALTMGTFSLFTALLLIIGGGGTRYPLDELRGQIGDACCK
jgi:hypothetical protein